MMRRSSFLNLSGSNGGSGRERDGRGSELFRASELFRDNFSVDGSSTHEGDSPDGPPQSRETMQQERQYVEKMAKEETRKVRVWRRNVFIVLAITAALVTTMTYLFLNSVDVDDFDKSFEQFAITIRDSTEFNLRGLIEATNGLSQVFTSEAIKTNSEWPFMTLSSFEVYVRNTRAQGASELIVVVPFVTADKIEQWNEYANEHQGWIDESFQEYDAGRLDLNPIPSSLYRFGRFKGRTVLKPEDGLGGYPAAPFWQMSRPPFDTSIVNFNSLSVEEYQQIYDAMMATRHWVMGTAGPNTLIDYTISEEAHDELHYAAEVRKNTTGFANNHPHTALVYPVFKAKDASHPTGSDINSPVVAMIINIIPWDNYLRRLLPKGVNGIYCVLHNSAGQSFTYSIRGGDAAYLGQGDLHETEFDGHEFRIDFAEFLGEAKVAASADVNASSVTDSDAAVAAAMGNGNLQYWFSVYPSQELKGAYDSNTPIIFTVLVACIFLFMTFTFILYDRFVIRKNKKIMDAATQSNAILASLFPQNVKERLLEDKAEEVKAEEAKAKRKKGAVAFKASSAMDRSLEDFFNADHEEDEGQEILDSQPIADLFPEATVMFADLVGFTAWSRTREPTEVFTLLETLYRNFDMIAKQRRVYKVETIGDCYVAVCGCPTPRKDHHIAMCRFAIECLRKMRQLTKKLESRLGPDTSTLDMRVGLHSGPVTGGVLRGERSRFQLFGDTMNVAARMESNGKAGRVHMSEATANLLIASGKAHWLKVREDKIVAKGKGEMQTFWLGKTSAGSGSAKGSESGLTESSGDTTGTDDEVDEVEIGDVGVLHMNHKTQRVVDWTVQSLMNLLERLVSCRDHAHEQGHTSKLASKLVDKIPVEEVEDVIMFRRYMGEVDAAELVLEQRIEDQLEMYVGTIASLYPSGNSFHNFDHASHVMMALLKLVSKTGSKGSSEDSICISSDRLAVFAMAFACLIHDVGHPGVSNERLCKENPNMAATYRQRSVAEQNSFTVAWNLLLEDRFTDLRSVIFFNEEETARFRQLVINSIMATDLFDKELTRARDARWEKAFGAKGTVEKADSPEELIDRKSTLVLEHMTQAADISHTMLHWEIYRKWNTSLFEEMHKGFSEGRAENDPSKSWYEGELWFFDNHAIPLAKRINSLGCFGVMGEEFVSNAESNRREWERKGRQIVADMMVASSCDKTLLVETAVVDVANIDEDSKESPNFDHRGEHQQSTGLTLSSATTDVWDDEVRDDDERTSFVDV